MAMLSNHPVSPPSLSLLGSQNFSIPKICKISKFLHNQRPFSLFSLSYSPTFPICFCSQSSIFLPLLEEDNEEDTQEVQNEKESLKGETSDSRTKRDDPILRFFESRNTKSDPNPGREGRITLQKNRKSSWHLAFERNNSVEEDDENKELDDFQVGKELNASTSTSTSTGIVSSEVGSVVQKILEKARKLQENSTLSEVLVGFEGKVSEKECVEVLEVMGNEGLTRGCLYFYEWMRLNEPPLVSPRACSVLFPYLGEAGKGNEIMVLFRNLPNEKRYNDVHVYNAAMSGILSSRRYRDALKVFECMEENNVQPDHVSGSIIITVMRKMGNSAKDAWAFFERMNRKGLKWSLEVSGALIKSFCQEGLKQEALIIQSEMEKRGIPSNAIIYNTIMDAYCHSNHIEEAEGLFTEMKAKGIAPTSASYNILMDAYSRRMQPEVVEDLLLEMENAGLEPNVKSYTCLVSAYGRQKKMSDMAADAFLRMRKAGINPTSHSYTALIHAYSVGGWHQKAYIAFESMLKEGVKPSIETYTALLDAARRAGDTETLMIIWKMMMREKIQGTRITFNTLLDGFAKQGHYVEARDVISEFGNIGFQPTVMTYNMLMNAYARGGQESKLPQLLKEMAALNLKPDSITYSTMIYAYVRVRDFRRAFYYHKQMVKSGQVPDARSYQKLRALLDVKAIIKNRQDKSALKGIINRNMRLFKEKRKPKKDEFWKNRKIGSRSPPGGSSTKSRS